MCVLVWLALGSAAPIPTVHGQNSKRIAQAMSKAATTVKIRLAQPLTVTHVRLASRYALDVLGIGQVKIEALPSKMCHTGCQ